jgi:hypothetical protein
VKSRKLVVVRFVVFVVQSVLCPVEHFSISKIFNFIVRRFLLLRRSVFLGLLGRFGNGRGLFDSLYRFDNRLFIMFLHLRYGSRQVLRLLDLLLATLKTQWRNNNMCTEGTV